MTLFSRIIYNTLETLPKGRFTNKRYIEYQFKVYDKVTVILIEIKTKLGGFNGYLDAIVQVMNECNGEFKSL